MNLKYFFGRSVRRAADLALSSPYWPLGTATPFGLSWAYDAARFFGSRRLETILDVGANVGQTARHLRRYFPQAQLHCFEPVPATCAVLEAAVGHLPGIHTHAIAIGEHDGALTMRVEAFSERSAVVASGESDGESCRVPARSLDSFAAERNLDRIDLLKIDVEGHELAVLAGAGRLLRERRVRLVFVEVGFDRADSGHTAFAEVEASLSPHGFAFSGLYECWRYGAGRHRIGFANALFFLPAEKSA